MQARWSGVFFSDWFDIMVNNRSLLNSVDLFPVARKDRYQ